MVIHFPSRGYPPGRWCFEDNGLSRTIPRLLCVAGNPAIVSASCPLCQPKTSESGCVACGHHSGLIPVISNSRSLSMGFLQCGYPKLLSILLSEKNYEINSPAIGVPPWAREPPCQVGYDPGFHVVKAMQKVPLPYRWARHPVVRGLAKRARFQGVFSEHLVDIQLGIISSIFVNMRESSDIMWYLIVQVDKVHMKNGDTRWLVNCHRTQRTQPHQLAIHGCIVPHFGTNPCLLVKIHISCWWNRPILIGQLSFIHDTHVKTLHFGGLNAILISFSLVNSPFWVGSVMVQSVSVAEFQLRAWIWPCDISMSIVIERPGSRSLPPQQKWWRLGRRCCEILSSSHFMTIGIYWRIIYDILWYFMISQYISWLFGMCFSWEYVRVPSCHALCQMVLDPAQSFDNVYRNVTKLSGERAYVGHMCFGESCCLHGSTWICHDLHQMSDMSWRTQAVQLKLRRPLCSAIRLLYTFCQDVLNFFYKFASKRNVNSSVVVCFPCTFGFVWQNMHSGFSWFSRIFLIQKAVRIMVINPPRLGPSLNTGPVKASDVATPGWKSSSPLWKTCSCPACWSTRSPSDSAARSRVSRVGTTWNSDEQWHTGTTEANYSSYRMITHRFCWGSSPLVFLCASASWGEMIPFVFGKTWKNMPRTLSRTLTWHWQNCSSGSMQTSCYGVQDGRRFNIWWSRAYWEHWEHHHILWLYCIDAFDCFFHNMGAPML